MSGLSNIILEQIKNLIEKDQLVLPTLPEVALKAREVAEDPMVTPAKLAQVIEKDPAISVRLIKVANSPLMRTLTPATDLKSAVSRLGLNFTSNLVVGLAMEQMFHASTDIIEEKMQGVWSHCADVAGKAAVLAQRCKIPADQALLAGLVHAIGVLPILTFIEENVPNFSDVLVLDQVAAKVSPKIGRVILESWDFAADMSSVPEESLNVYRHYGEEGDCADAVLVANLISRSDFFATVYRDVEWPKVTAFDRLDLTLVEGSNAVEEMEELSEKFEAVSEMFKTA